MATVADNLNKIIQIKQDIKLVLIEKKVEPTGGLDTYVDSIEELYKAKYEMSFNDDLMAVKVNMDNEDITEEVVNGGNVSIPHITGDLDITISEFKSITYITDLITVDNDLKFVPIGYPYSANIECALGSEFDRITIMMGNEDITAEVFSADTTNTKGTINIESVDGDLVISLYSKVRTYTVNSTLTNTISLNTNTKVLHGNQYSTIISPEAHYAITKVQVYMGNQVIADNSYDVSEELNTYEINIPSVIEDITIIAKSEIIVRNINFNYNGVTPDNVNTTINDGDLYLVNYTFEEGFEFKNVQVLMGGHDVTSTVFLNNTLNILSVNADVEITVEAGLKEFTITYSINENITSSNSSATLLYGDSFEAELQTTSHYDIINTVVFMGGLNITPTVVQNNSINISKVTGNIEISAEVAVKHYSITRNFTYISSNSEVIDIEDYLGHSEVLTPDTYMEISTISIFMGTEDITEQVYSDGVISIEHVTDNLTITGIATRINCTITNNLTGVTTNNPAKSVLMGESYQALLTMSDAAMEMDVTVTVGGEPYYNFNIENGLINIPEVLGNIVITASAVTELKPLLKTIDHYTLSDIEDIDSGESADIMLISPCKNLGYVLGLDESSFIKYGNGYRNPMYMFNEVAEVAEDPKYKFTISKTLPVKVTNEYADVPKTISVTASFNKIGFTKLTSNIPGHDLYGLASNNSINGGNKTYSGAAQLSFDGTSLPKTIYFKLYNSGQSGVVSKYGTGTYTINGQTVCTAGNSQEVDSLDDFTAYTMTSNVLDINITQTNTRSLSSSTNNVNCWILVPNDIVETVITGTTVVNDGDPYFSLNNFGSTRNNKKLYIETFDTINDSNIIDNIYHVNNPCIFAFKDENGDYLTGGNLFEEVSFSSVISSSALWYFGKPNSVRFTTQNVTIDTNINVPYTNQVNSVKYGDSYENQILFNEGELPYKVEITMNGHNITAAAYNEGYISIPAVYGPVTITVIVLNTDAINKVTWTLIDVGELTNKSGYSPTISTSEYDAVIIGDVYSAQPSFNSLITLSENNYGIYLNPSDSKYMKVIECTVDMNGETLHDCYDEATNTISFTILGDAHITVKAIKVIGYVENMNYDSDNSGNHIVIDNDALSSGTYIARFDNIGEDLQEYDNITLFNL